jgi:hypothetical protein
VPDAAGFGGRLEALAIGAQAGQQPGSQHRAGARKAAENLPVGMLGERLSDLNVVLFDGLDDQLQFPANELHAQDKTLDEGGFISDGHGFLNQG